MELSVAGMSAANSGMKDEIAMLKMPCLFSNGLMSKLACEILISAVRHRPVLTKMLQNAFMRGSFGN
jgi:hypothetical protein